MSSMTIRVITYGKDAAEARQHAQVVVDNLIEDKHFQGCSECSSAFRYSADGKKLLDEGMEYTRNTFLMHLKEVRKAINNKTDEALFEERDLFKHHMYCAGQYVGNTVYVYDSDGEGVKDTTHLDNAINKWECLYESNPSIKEKYAGLDVWVTTATVWD